eukprot:4017771-Amphidinium_carterae.1
MSLIQACCVEAPLNHKPNTQRLVRSQLIVACTVLPPQKCLEHARPHISAAIQHHRSRSLWKLCRSGSGSLTLLRTKKNT